MTGKGIDNNNLPNNKEVRPDVDHDVHGHGVVVLRVLLRVGGVGLHVEVQGCHPSVHLQHHSVVDLMMNEHVDLKR